MLSLYGMACCESVLLVLDLIHLGLLLPSHGFSCSDLLIFVAGVA